MVIYSSLMVAHVGDNNGVGTLFVGPCMETGPSPSSQVDYHWKQASAFTRFRKTKCYESNKPTCSSNLKKSN